MKKYLQVVVVLSPMLGFLVAFLVEDVELFEKSKCYGRADFVEQGLAWSAGFTGFGIGLLLGGITGILKYIRNFSLGELFRGKIGDLIGALFQGTFLAAIVGGLIGWALAFGLVLSLFC